MFTVTAGTVPGMPAAIAAWRAGACPTPPWMHVAHDHVLDGRDVDSRARDRRAYRDGAELRRVQRREPAKKAADGRAGSRNDYRSAVRAIHAEIHELVRRTGGSRPP